MELKHVLFKGWLYLEDIDLEQSITALDFCFCCVVMELFPNKEESHKK